WRDPAPAAASTACTGRGPLRVRLPQPVSPSSRHAIERPSRDDGKRPTVESSVGFATGLVPSWRQSMTITTPARTGGRVPLGRLLDRHHVLVTASSPWARRFGAMVVAGGFGSLVLWIVHGHHAPDWSPSGRLAWSLSLLVAVMFIARG